MKKMFMFRWEDEDVLGGQYGIGYITAFASSVEEARELVRKAARENGAADTVLPCGHPASSGVLVIYDRPGSPPGNGWGCSECTKERENGGLDGATKS